MIFKQCVQSLTSKSATINFLCCYMEWHQEYSIPRYRKHFPIKFKYYILVVQLQDGAFVIAKGWLQMHHYDDSLKTVLMHELYIDFNSLQPSTHTWFYHLFYHDWHLFDAPWVITCKMMSLDSEEVIRISWGGKRVLLHASPGTTKITQSIP